jgi:transglutaminase-like putative cysteine protease
MSDAYFESTPSGMFLSVRHLTRYLYEGEALESFNDVRLRPISDPLQRCVSFNLRVEPAAEIKTHFDFYQNRVDHFELHVPHQRLEIASYAEVETRADRRGPVPSGLSLESLNDRSVEENYFDFVVESKFVPQNVAIWREALDAIGGQVTDLWADALKIGHHVYRTFSYDPDWTHVHTDASSALRDRRGVCQDYAHVMIALCRSQGIPARYVSGYFFNGKTGDENEASHAWLEVFLPHYGWKAWDPTHDREADTRYIKLANGRDYGDIKPVSGSFRGRSTQNMEVIVQIRQLNSLSA